MVSIGNIRSATLLLVVQFSHYWSVMGFFFEFLWLLVVMEYSVWMRWCWIGGSFRIVVSQVLNYLLHYMGLCQVGAAIISSVNVHSQELFKSSFLCNFQAWFLRICNHSVQILFIWACNYWVIFIYDIHELPPLEDTFVNIWLGESWLL